MKELKCGDLSQFGDARRLRFGAVLPGKMQLLQFRVWSERARSYCRVYDDALRGDGCRGGDGGAAGSEAAAAGGFGLFRRWHAEFAFAGTASGSF